MIQPINLRRPSVSLVLASAGILSYSKPAFAEESWVDSLKNKIVPTVVMNVGPLWFDLTASSLEDYVEEHEIVPVKVSDFDTTFRREFEKTFPAEVLASSEIYIGVPLTSLEERIGWVNYVTDIVGGVPPWGQTIGTNIYLQNFDVNLAGDRKKLAHELVHVAQYMELGYEGFRTGYLEAIAHDIPFEKYEEIPLEAKAYDFERQWPRVAPLELKTEVKDEDENTISLNDFFHVNNWSPQFYDDMEDPTSCVVRYSSKNPKTHRTEEHVLSNAKINLLERRDGARYVNFVETSDGERIPLEAIEFMKRENNGSTYEIGDMESSVTGLSLHNFAFVGYSVDDKAGGGSFFLTKDKGRITINCSLEN